MKKKLAIISIILTFTAGERFTSVAYGQTQKAFTSKEDSAWITHVHRTTDSIALAEDERLLSKFGKSTDTTLRVGRDADGINLKAFVTIPQLRARKQEEKRRFLTEKN